MNQLEQLRTMTTVVADTGDMEAMRAHRPQDATTNPSLLLAAAQQPQYRHLVEDAVRHGLAHGQDRDTQARHTMDKLAVNFGAAILDIVPGRVSTEIDARLSFDRDGTVERAESLLALYDEAGIAPERLLLKIAATWEGMEAARILESRGVHCNLTLMFSFPQAVACAEAGITLISPFVGRILDWYRKTEGVDGYEPADDPGVKSVTRIFNHFKKHDYPTVVMGASFRNTDEILELAGCDLLTISPKLMQKLASSDAPVERRLDPEKARAMELEHVTLDEKGFRWSMNDDAMATEKLAEGIRKFAQDTVKLETFARSLCDGC
ncbi:MAG: transaldolase [Pseudomonadota bacterium]